MMNKALELIEELKHLAGEHDQHSHGRRQIIQAVGDELRDKPTEEISFLDGNGNEIKRVVGNEKSVSANLSFFDRQRMLGGTLIHNHPNGTSFSIDDLAAGAKVGAAELRVVTPHTTYVMKPKNVDIQKAGRLYNDYAQPILDEMERRVASGKLDAETFDTRYSHAVWLAVSEDMPELGYSED